MKQVPRDLLEEIRARNDIVDVIGGYLHLIKAGSRFKALCPFHKEKTPSFHVNPQMQAYHCFGCGAGGDVFRFVMEHEGVDFPTAVRLLAHRVGLPITLAEDAGGTRSRVEKDTLYSLHEEVTRYYAERLKTDPNAESARTYLAKRDLAGKIAEAYRFGFAPSKPGLLNEWAKNKKIEDSLLVKAGLLAERERDHSLYDRFRGRLMIPICDELGRVIAFTGRVLRPEDSPAKYVNSPETPLFRKSRVLFGLHRARKAITEHRTAILCEGQIDTIRCQWAGLLNTVAAQGTAVTDEHARLLARYADEVVLVLDPDAAGRRAAVRTAHVLIGVGLSVRVALLPEGEDPDSLLRRVGPKALNPVLSEAVTAMKFLVDEEVRASGLAGEAGLVRASRSAIELASRATTEVQREQLLRDAAGLLGVTDQAFRADYRKAVSARRSASVSIDNESPPPATENDPPEEIQLIEVALASPSACLEIRRYLPPARLTSPRCRAALSALLDGGPETLHDAVSRSGDSGLARLAGELMVSSRLSVVSPDEYPPEHIARELIRKFWRRRLEQHRADIRVRLRKAKGSEKTTLESTRTDLSLRLAALAGTWKKARAVIEAELDAGEEDAAESV